MAGKNSALSGHVRRMCSLGIEPRIVIPHVVEALRQIVDAEWGMFFYADENYQLSDVFTENRAVFDTFSTYMSEIHNNTAEQAVLGTPIFSSGMRRGRGYENTAHFDKALLESMVYAEVWRPIGLRHSLELTASDGTRGWGSVQLQRPLGAPPFTEGSHGKIAGLSRHIAHALTIPCPADVQHADDGHSAILVVDETGKLLLESADALRIISLAGGESIAFSRTSHLPAWLNPLILNFRRLWHGGVTEPSMLRRRNAAGLFSFKAYRFDGGSSLQDRIMIALYVEHYPPLALRVETLGFSLGLSERQRELCCALITGSSHGTIAGRMSVKESTIVDHVREVYRKLDVHSRDELRRKFRPSVA